MWMLPFGTLTHRSQRNAVCPRATPERVALLFGAIICTMESHSLPRRTAGRPRYQRGSLMDDGDRWIARWREDVRLPNETVERVRRKDVIASKRECPILPMAQRRLDELLREVNGKPSSSVLPSDLRAIEVVLCDACRERLLAALQAKPKAAVG